MSGPYEDSITAIEAAWTAGWPAPVGVPVVWHQNTNDQTPAAATYQHWLHVAVEHTSERLVAFGGGRAANERELLGSVVIRAMAQRGRGEATLLSLLDQAISHGDGKVTDRGFQIEHRTLSTPRIAGQDPFVTCYAAMKSEAEFADFQDAQ